MVDYSTPLRQEGLAVDWGVALQAASLVSEEEGPQEEDYLEIDLVEGCLATLAVEVWGVREEEGGSLDRTRRHRRGEGCLMLVAAVLEGELPAVVSSKHQPHRVSGNQSLHSFDSEKCYRNMIVLVDFLRQCMLVLLL